MIKRAINI